MIDLNNPECGWYKTRLVKGGPFVPAKIWYEDGDRCPDTGELMSDQILMCMINTEARNPFVEWTRLAKSPITEAEYDLMIQQRDWDEENDPGSKSQNPREAIDLLTQKSIF